MRNLGTRLLLTVCALICPTLAWAQGGLPASPIQFSGPTGRPLAGATVTVCTSAGTGFPCTPQASIYTNAGLTLASPNPVTTDGNGNLPVIFAAPGVYILSVTGSGITSTLVTATVAGTGGGNVVLNANNAFTGNNTHSGIETFTNRIGAGNINDTLWVDGVQYTTIAAAVTAAGANNRIIVIPSTYGGSECPAAPSNKIQFWDFRGSQLCPQNSITSFSTSGLGLYSFIRPIYTTSVINNGGAVGHYVQVIGSNATASGGSAFLDAGAHEIDISGTLTGTISTLQVVEEQGLITSNGGAITTFTGGVFYVNQTSGNTPITNVHGADFIGCNTMAGSVAPVNCIGAVFSRQSAGSGKNFSIEMGGVSRADYDSNRGAGGWEMEDTSHVTHLHDYVDSSNVTHYAAVNAAGTRFEDSTGTAQATLTSTGLTIAKILPLPNNTVALTADWTCGTAGTVSSCVAATIIGSGGGVPLTLTLPLIAQSYTLECDGVVGQATAATANQWNLLTATNGATNVTANYSMATAATASAYGAVTNQASTTSTFQIAPSWTLGGTATKMPFHIWAKIEGASVSGTVVSLQLVAPTVGDLVTIYRGAACRVF